MNTNETITGALPGRIGRPTGVCAAFFIGLTIGLMSFGSVQVAAQGTTAPRDTIKTTPVSLPTPPPNTLERDLVGNALLDASFPGSWGIPGTRVRMGIFGFVKADYVQDIRLNTNPFEFTISTIPLEGTPDANRGGRTTLHANSSRFVMVARSISAQGWPLQAMISFDFGWDALDKQDLVRRRMAYVVVGNVLAGQTWSTFADLSALIYTLDFEGGDALIGARVPQFRYTGEIGGGGWSWSAAIEEPRGKIDNIPDTAGVAQPNTPEVVGRIRWKKDRNHLQLTGLVNQLRFAFDDGSGSARALKYGANFTGLFVFGGGDREMVSFGVAGGEGIASWAASTGSEPLDAILTADGDLTTLPFLEYNVGFRHNWTKDWNSAILWAHSKAWLDDLQSPDTFSDGGVFHVNLLWTSAKRLLTGIEYIWGYRETKDGRRGVADRVQFSLKWQFNP